MPSKRVAVEGDVVATVGVMPFTGAQSGVWTAGTVSYTGYDHFTCRGRKVVWQASCTFTFRGGNAAGRVTGSETVTLTATTTLLNKGQTSVLVDGDAKTGGDLPTKFDNKLVVAASGPLKTA